MKLLLTAASLAASFCASVMAGEIPKFGKTCVGDYGLSSSICLSSNGKVIASTYLFRGKYRTKGVHTGCSLKGSTIACSGGKYQTSDASGKMNPITVTMSKGKPVSIAWR